MTKLMDKEQIKSIKNYVEPSDAQALINLMEELKLKDQLNNERGDGTFRLYNSDNPVLVDFVKKYSNKFIDQEELYVTENLVGLYEEGAFMKVHRDVEDESETISTVIYLNDEYEGGELSFPEIDGGYTYRPEKYELIYFPTPYLHGVNPVISGKRYIITISYTDKVPPNATQYWSPKVKVCKVCSPEAKTPCQLASTTCPYRDMDTLI
jgi:predicted 2-oxoglutarate/Fe(II)-dependent dioxygenase YbiX